MKCRCGQLSDHQSEPELDAAYLEYLGHSKVVDMCRERYVHTYKLTLCHSVYSALVNSVAITLTPL